MATHGLTRSICDVCGKSEITENRTEGLGERALWPKGWANLHWQYIDKDGYTSYQDKLVCSFVCLTTVAIEAGMSNAAQ